MTAYLFPGQGSQKVGMGEQLFTEFPHLVDTANQILGFSISDLCMNDPHGQLSSTEFTQPALFIVNALTYLKKIKEGHLQPRYFLGHSLGEYNALWAAGVFDFETGVRLVQKRGALMGRASSGAMAAVIGLKSVEVQAVLEQHQLNHLTIANYNSYLQQVLSGPSDQIKEAKSLFLNAGAKLYLPIAAKGAFHSSLMQEASVQFKQFLLEFHLDKPKIPVIANLNALPYQQEAMYDTLSLQIDNSVQWLGSIRYLLAQGVTEFEEVGPGKVLANLVARITNGQ
jgi:malonyl CoA-acyl carrier protein transacylase